MKGGDQRTQEQLSGLLDGELTDGELDRLLEEMRREDELKSTLSRYAAIGHVIRNGTAPRAEPDLWRRVSAALEEEPTVLAPRRAVQAEPVPVRQRFVSYALAASLAGVALLVGKSFVGQSSGLTGPSMATVASVSTDLRQTRNMASAQSRFDDYLLAHNQSAQMAGAGGFLPYARLVSVKHDY